MSERTEMKSGKASPMTADARKLETIGFDNHMILWYARCRRWDVSDYVPSLRQLRWERTRASNRVLGTMRHMLTDEAKWTSPDGLPSWWPFWSDALKSNVREAVKAARMLSEREGVL